MSERRSEGAPWALARSDMEDAQQCKNPEGCAKRFRTRVRLPSGDIVPVCPGCAARLTGTNPDVMERALGGWG